MGARGRRPLWSPCVKSRSQNWDPTSWKSRLKSFQVSILETASVKIQAPKLRSQVLKTMSWKPYPKISQAPKLRSQVPKTMSWKPYPKSSQAPKLRSRVLKTMSWKPYPKISQAPKSAGPVSRPPWVLPGPSHSHSPRPLSTKLLSGGPFNGKDCWMVRIEMVRTERNCIID